MGLKWVKVARFDPTPEGIKSLEAEHGMKVLQALPQPDGWVVEGMDVADAEVMISVYNCTATAYVGDLWEHDLEFTEQEQAALEDLKERIVEEENEGSFTWSGRYYPQTEETARAVRSVFARGTLRVGGPGPDGRWQART